MSAATLLAAANYELQAVKREFLNNTTTTTASASTSAASIAAGEWERVRMRFLVCKN